MQGGFKGDFIEAGTIQGLWWRFFCSDALDNSGVAGVVTEGNQAAGWDFIKINVPVLNGRDF